LPHPRIYLVVAALGLWQLGAYAEPKQLVAWSERRLQLAELVARVKWHQHLPIEDREREGLLLNSIEDLGWRQLMANQIEASKMVQRECFEYWRTHPCPEPRLDLFKLRDWIDQCNQELQREWLDSPRIPRQQLPHPCHPHLLRALESVLQ
jgi:chorismate mutase-like protein